MLYQLESAQNRPFLSSEANWTATYRRDSTLVTPYGWWRPSEDGEEDGEYENTAADFAGAREGRVAWFVSNCAADNQRLEYGRALGGSYPVDVYGKCGELRCSRVRREQYSTVQYSVQCVASFCRGHGQTAGKWWRKSTNITSHLKIAIAWTT